MVEEDEIILDQSLVDQGIIDSFGLIEIAAYIENEYDITVPEEDMTRDNFGSTLKIIAYIKNRIKNG